MNEQQFALLMERLEQLTNLQMNIEALLQRLVAEVELTGMRMRDR